MDPDDTYRQVLRLVSTNLCSLGASLVVANRVRGFRLFQCHTYFALDLAGLGEGRDHLASLSKLYGTLGDACDIAFLVDRAVDDIDLGFESLLAGRHGLVGDAMRDVMEIEMLLRDFAGDKDRLERWLKSDDRTRRREYAPAVVRRRVAEDLYPGKALDLPEAREYSAHSVALHPTPYRPLTGGREFCETTDPHTIHHLLGELVEHTARVIRAGYYFLGRLNTGIEPPDPSTDLRFLTRALFSFRDHLSKCLPAEVIGVREPTSRRGR